jgi:hypothetical protein
MSILETFQKNFDSLKDEYSQYKDYHDTMIGTIPQILELLDGLFMEDNIKALDNYSLLVEDYLNPIKETLAPDNYKQLKLEGELPDIYDAPRARRDKAKKITKMKAKRVIMPTPRISTAASSIAPATAATAATATAATTTTTVTTTPVPGEKIDKALKMYVEEGKRVFNYKSPLDCQKDKEGPPNKVAIELPDDSHTKAYLYDDGKIIDFNNRELGYIDKTGKVMIGKSELGSIKLVRRDDLLYIPMTNNYGKVKM